MVYGLHTVGLESDISAVLSHVHGCRLSATELYRSLLLLVSGTNYRAMSRLRRPLCEFSAVVCRLTFPAVHFPTVVLK